MNNQGISVPFWIKNYERPIPVLDYLTYTTDLASAWSTQRVVISGYFGNLVKLRRSSDNDEQDFGYSVLTGEVDNTAIDTWAGADQVFYVKIYDQNGANDYIQTTTTLQPERVSNRAFSNNDKMMVMTSTTTNENITMIDRAEATVSALNKRINMANSLVSPPYRTLMFRANPAYFDLYIGAVTTNNYYRLLQQYITIPLDTILGYGFGGAVTNNLLSYNASIFEDITPQIIGSPTSYFTTINISWFYKTNYAATYQGYIDERYHYSELLNSTNYGTVRTYINDKYSVY